MWAYERTIEAAATPQEVWAIYEDVANWPSWDRGIKGVGLSGSLATGASGWISPRGDERLPFSVTWAEPGRGFTGETRVMGHVARFRHTLEALPSGGVRIRHRVEVEGPAEYDFGPNIVSDVVPALARLAALAEAAAGRAGRGRGPEGGAPTAR